MAIDKLRTVARLLAKLEIRVSGRVEIAPWLC